MTGEAPWDAAIVMFSTGLAGLTLRILEKWLNRVIFKEDEDDDDEVQ